MSHTKLADLLSGEVLLTARGAACALGTSRQRVEQLRMLGAIDGYPTYGEENVTHWVYSKTSVDARVAAMARLKRVPIRSSAQLAGQRFCADCDTTRPLTAFWRNAKRGYQTYCKVHQATRNAEAKKRRQKKEEP